MSKLHNFHFVKFCVVPNLDNISMECFPRMTILLKKINFQSSILVMDGVIMSKSMLFTKLWVMTLAILVSSAYLVENS